MTKRQLRYFNQAKEIAQQSDFPRVHIGAIVVYKHQVISKGCNTSSKTHRIQSQLNKKRFNANSSGMF